MSAESEDYREMLDEFAEEVRRLRGMLWYAWSELNAIRARSGVPLDYDGWPQRIFDEIYVSIADLDYWNGLVDMMAEELGDDAMPWPSKDAKKLDLKWQRGI